MTAKNADWWDEHIVEAGDNLEEYFGRDVEFPSYADCVYIAQNVLLLSTQMIVLDPAAGKSDEERAHLWDNLVRLQDLAGRIYRRETVVEAELVAAKFVLAHFTPVGELSEHALMACRFALSAILMVNSTVVIPEQFPKPGPEAWCLAAHAYDALSRIGEEDHDDRPKGAFWVGVDAELVGRSRAHQVNMVITQMGGTPGSPN